MKKIIGIALLFLLLCGCMAPGDTEPVGAEVPNPYPPLASPELASYPAVPDVTFLLLMSDAAFAAEVTGTPETVKATVDGRTFSAQRTAVRIESVIKGDLSAGDEVFIVQGSFDIGYAPALNKGDRFVFFTAENDVYGGWQPGFPHASCFYITEEGRVFPAAVEIKALAQYNNMRLDDFLSLCKKEALVTQEEYARRLQTE